MGGSCGGGVNEQPRRAVKGAYSYEMGFGVVGLLTGGVIGPSKYGLGPRVT